MMIFAKFKVIRCIYSHLYINVRIVRFLYRILLYVYWEIFEVQNFLMSHFKLLHK